MKVQLVLFIALLASVFAMHGEIISASNVEISLEKKNGDDTSIDDLAANEFSDATSHEPFIATDDWQELKEGQAIPPGLHVEMDLTTGRKRAKKLEESTSKINNALTVTESQDNPNNQDMTHAAHTKKHVRVSSWTKEELRSKLSKLDDFKNLERIDDEDEAFRIEEIRKQFRTPEELKAVMEELQKERLFIKKDVQVMIELLEVLTSTESTEEELIAALNALADLSNQFDNGSDLEKIGGLEIVVSFLSPNQSAEIKSAAAMLLGTTIHNNPYAQNAALSHGALFALLHLLSADHGNKMEPLIVRKRGFYALSSLLRGSDDAITQFLQYNGMHFILSQMHSEPDLQVKALTLVVDLVTELDEKISSTTSANKSFYEDAIRQLTTQQWCSEMNGILEKWSIELGLNFIEKTLLALKNMHKYCSRTLNVAQNANNLAIALQSHNFASEEFYKELAQLANIVAEMYM